MKGSPFPPGVAQTPMQGGGDATSAQDCATFDPALRGSGRGRPR